MEVDEAIQNAVCFGYEEESESSAFFIPHAWAVAVRQNPELYWYPHRIGLFDPFTSGLLVPNLAFYMHEERYYTGISWLSILTHNVFRSGHDSSVDDSNHLRSRTRSHTGSKGRLSSDNIV
jgi:hypothetical protein